MNSQDLLPSRSPGEETSAWQRFLRFSISLSYSWEQDKNNTCIWSLQVCFLPIISPSNNSRPTMEHREDDDVNRTRKWATREETHEGAQFVFHGGYQQFKWEKLEMKMNWWLMSVHTEGPDGFVGHGGQVKGWRRGPGSTLALRPQTESLSDSTDTASKDLLRLALGEAAHLVMR